jgi:hypothetical protein
VVEADTADRGLGAESAGEAKPDAAAGQWAGTQPHPACGVGFDNRKSPAFASGEPDHDQTQNGLDHRTTMKIIGLSALIDNTINFWLRVSGQPRNP